jgi:hypothetical protein
MEHFTPNQLARDAVAEVNKSFSLIECDSSFTDPDSDDVALEVDREGIDKVSVKESAVKE